MTMYVVDDHPLIRQALLVVLTQLDSDLQVLEAATALVTLAFEHYPLHRLYANLDPRNERSAALCVRVGMKLEAQRASPRRDAEHRVACAACGDQYVERGETLERVTQR